MNRPAASQRGFTLIELLAVVGILAVLASIALPRLFAATEKAKVARAIADISTINKAVITYQALHSGDLPDNMSQMIPAQIPQTMLDPWGKAYVYNNFDYIPPGWRRKDGALVPINKQYDIFSEGPNGTSSFPTNSGPGKDDILFANDGGFIDIAEKY
ncbi:MAG: prepilin-type N-terminal cleavage/methylation domain-containing protein [Candidatus Hydrogenedentota bacterium]